MFIKMLNRINLRQLNREKCKDFNKFINKR